MKIVEHNFENRRVAEIISDKVLISSEQDALELMVSIEYQNNCKTIILQRHNFCDEFFDLKSGLAGAILQKFVNYKVRLIIAGDFSAIKSKSFNDFIFETNKYRQIIFLPDVSTALDEIRQV